MGVATHLGIFYRSGKTLPIQVFRLWRAGGRALARGALGRLSNKMGVYSVKVSTYQQPNVVFCSRHEHEFTDAISKTGGVGNLGDHDDGL